MHERLEQMARAWDFARDMLGDDKVRRAAAMRGATEAARPIARAVAQQVKKRLLNAPSDPGAIDAEGDDITERADREKRR
jgi:hypothetical protein